jgi:triosephosphate isomerase
MTVGSYYVTVPPTGLNKEVISAQLSEGLVGITAEQATGIVVAYEPVSC